MIVYNVTLSNTLFDALLGHEASRDTKYGTLFVRSIDAVFREHAKTKDILTLMIQVHYEESHQFVIFLYHGICCILWVALYALYVLRYVYCR